MTKAELDKRARGILDSKHHRNIRNNMVLANTEDLSRILDMTLRDVQIAYGQYDQYTLKVVSETDSGYLLLFPGGQEIEMGWEVENEN